MVDGNGAGDAFVSAFPRSWSRKARVEECLMAGAVSGAFARTGTGTHTDFVDAAELERFTTVVGQGTPDVGCTSVLRG